MMIKTTKEIANEYDDAWFDAVDNLKTRGLKSKQKANKISIKRWVCVDELKEVLLKLMEKVGNEGLDYDDGYRKALYDINKFFPSSSSELLTSVEKGGAKGKKKVKELTPLSLALPNDTEWIFDTLGWNKPKEKRVGLRK